MFDALRWAEDQRRRLSSRSQEAPKHEPTRRPGSVLSSGDMGVPADMVRELGILRNSLEPVFTNQDKRTILFTSSTAGEGTTTVATGFARFLSLQGMSRILVCEMNARHPSFSDVFSINGDLGITDYFLRDTTISSIVQASDFHDLDILQVGGHDPSTIQLHLSNAFPRFLKEAKEQYDTILIDAPPVISSPESPAMASFVDGVVMVVRAGKTKREIVQRALDAIGQFEGKMLGIVLNRKKYYIPEFLYKRI